MWRGDVKLGERSEGLREARGRVQDRSNSNASPSRALSQPFLSTTTPADQLKLMLGSTLKHQFKSSLISPSLTRSIKSSPAIATSRLTQHTSPLSTTAPLLRNASTPAMNDDFGPQPKTSQGQKEPMHAVHSEHKDDSWKTRPPYVFREVPQDQAAYKGACHCGRVQYVLTREKSLASKYCHCK